MVAQAAKGTSPQSPIYSETVWLLADIKKHIPHAPAKGRLYQWARFGALNRFTRQRVYLEVIWDPVGLATSEQAIQRFRIAINAQQVEPQTPVRPLPSTRPANNGSFKKGRRKRKKS